jgi:predicted CXXCH cytochrome family protein
MRSITNSRWRRADGSWGNSAILRVAWFILVVLATSLPTLAVEHPGSIANNAECSSCHASKLMGKSVHSAMATSCAICHVTQTRGDMTVVSLAAPKERICFSCHQQAESLRLHRTTAKGLCLDCHDAHSSDREMLLRVAQAVPVRVKNR